MNLGAIKSKYDARDLKLGAVQEPISYPEIYLPDYSNLPKYWQNGLPTCGANAGSFFKVIQEFIESKTAKSFSPRFLWIKIKEIDNNALQVGTDMRSIFKTLKSIGVCDNNLINNDVSMSLIDYTNSQPITQNMLDNAQPNIINSYAFVDDLSFEGIKNAIYRNGVVLLRLLVGRNFFNTTTLTIPAGRLSGHFIVAYGYDKDWIYFRDSTEKDFTKSDKKFGKDYMNWVKEGGTALDLDNDYIRALINKRETLQKIVELIRKVLEWLKGRK